jgi:TolB-like protein
VKNKLVLTYEDLGAQTIKNIAEPVRAYRVAGAKPAMTLDHHRGAALARPDKPSIAVLPLTNMSGDPEQEYFSDGITEDIITELARFSTLFVIARHSSFAFKGAKLDITEVGRKLGVQYVVEGSVRRAGNRVRISAQLIEAETGNHIWAERYDRDLDDIFAVQDEVTRSIVAVLPGRVQANVADRASRKPTDNMKAYELMLRAKSLRDGLNAEDTAQARRLLEKAIEIDPRYARAHMYLADTYVVDLWLGLATAHASGVSLQLARKGAGLDSNDVYIQDQLGFAYLCEGLWDDAEVQFDKTLSQIVNEAESMAWCGYGFMLLGRHEKARDIVLEAMRLDPLHPPALDWILGQIYYFGGHYADVIRVLIGEALLNSLAHAFLAGAYAHLGRVSEARSALDAFVRERRREFGSRNIVVEDDSIAALAGGYRMMWRNEADWDHIANGLRKAGLSD